MMWGYGWSHGGTFAMVAMLLWWVLIVLGIALIVKWLFRSGSRPGADDQGGRAGRGDRALAILRERYARGEIDKQEFEERKRDLAS